MADEYARRQALEQELVQAETPCRYRGWCQVCARESEFESDLLYADGSELHGKPVPNWRERLLCTGCGLNNRVRASLHFLDEKLRPGPLSKLYISEQSTPLYQQLRRQRPFVTGSEYLGSALPFGQIDPRTGYRNESVTSLSFADASQDIILSFDVFEHVPDYGNAFRESLRVLKPDGTLLFTVPFTGGARNLVRARLDAQGNIEHLCEPEYHGDPVNSAGCLCFYHFGWEMLDELRALGFRDAGAELFWSARCAYLGTELLLFTAEK